MEIANYNQFDLNIESASVSQYIRKVNLVPILTPEEEKYHMNKYFNEKNQASGNAIIIAHLRLVVKIAQGFGNYGFPLMELISEGNYGLLTALKKFDCSKGLRFSTYATWWVKAKIQEYIMKSWSVVKMGTSNLHRKMFSSKDSSNLPKLRRDLSIDAENAENNYSSESFENAIVDHIDKQKMLEKIKFKSKSLSDREKKVVFMRLFREPVAKLEEISKELNISKERVRQIFEKAVRKLS